MHNFTGLNLKHDNFRKSTFMDAFDEPTYLTFALDFNMEPLPASSDVDENLLWNSPLFDDKSGAVNFLINRGYNPQADGLVTFREILRYLTFQAPWYFQEITGLDKLYAAATDIEKKSLRTKGITIGVKTLEAIDLRINELAGIYRNSIYDTKYRRARVPDNLRWFSVDVYLAEFRNMRYRLPGIAQNAGNLLGINTAAIGNVVGGGNAISNVLKQYGYIKFRLRQCEFDFSDTLPTGSSIKVGSSGRSMETNNFSIKVGWVEEEAKYGDGTIVYDDPMKTDIRNPWGARNTGTSIQNAGSWLSGLPVIGDAISEFGEKVGDALGSVGGMINPALNAASDFIDPPITELGDIYETGYSSNGDTPPTRGPEPSGNLYP